jgi:hypothetical protein
LVRVNFGDFFFFSKERERERDLWYFKYLFFVFLSNLSMHDAQLRTLLSRPSLKKRPFPWQTCPSYVRELLTGLKFCLRLAYYITTRKWSK